MLQLFSVTVLIEEEEEEYGPTIIETNAVHADSTCIIP
jgi:hypothetical protein